MSDEEIDDMITGDIIVIGRKSNSDAGIENNGKKFGFSWFIPTILKYKRQFISVLVAVFVVQVLGILTPLMT